MNVNLLAPVDDDFEPEFFSYHNEENSNVGNTSKTNNEEQIEPEDKHNIVYILCYFLGTTILFPWFFFIMCSDYWMYRFRDIHVDVQYKYLLNQNFSNRTTLQTDFIAYVSIASTFPSALFLFFNLFFLKKFPSHWRILCSWVIILLLLTETTVLVFFNSDSWQNLFLAVTIITVVVLNMAGAMLQAALGGIFMKFPVAYISAFSSGQSVAGMIAAIAQICTLFIKASPEINTFLYFMFANVTVLASLIGYLYIRKVEFYNFYTNDMTNVVADYVNYRRLTSNPVYPIRVDYKTVQKRIWIPSLSLFITNFITSSIYPALAVLVCSDNISMKSVWKNEYFVPVVTYLNYSASEYVGRVSISYVQKPEGKSLVLLSFARLCFIPLLMFCNAEPRHYLPVYIDSDLIYSLIIILFAFSNGYISTLTFFISSKNVYPHEQEVASIILVTWLAVAFSLGAVFSLQLVNML